MNAAEKMAAELKAILELDTKGYETFAEWWAATERATDMIGHLIKMDMVSSPEPFSKIANEIAQIRPEDEDIIMYRDIAASTEDGRRAAFAAQGVVAFISGIGANDKRAADIIRKHITYPVYWD